MRAACIGLALGQLGDAQAWLSGLCTAAERRHAGRYRQGEDGMRHLAGRALLRTVLLACGGFDARGRELEPGRFGRPLLAGCPLSFNLTHAGDQVWVALSTHGQVGIDVEKISALEGFPLEALELRERQELSRLASPAQATACAWTWVRKEAVVKASGTGLTVDPAHYSVSTQPGPVADWLRQPPPDAAALWSCRDFEPAPGYAGAVALAGARLDALHCAELVDGTLRWRESPAVSAGDL